MTSDESDAIRSYNLDDDSHDDLPQRSYWWSLHRPETYALVAVLIAFSALISIGPAQEIAQAILFSVNGPSSEKDLLYAVGGIRLALSLLAIVAAVISIRSEDDDTTWSPPVARAAILLAILDAVLSAASLIVTATVSDSPESDF
jgi:uncharacterized BrkB/YihY/UPF0761 family membrane protein